MGDTAYGTASMLGWMVKDKGIAPHVPVWDRSERKDGTLSNSEFAWDEQANEYRCRKDIRCAASAAQFTKPSHATSQGRPILYSASRA